MLSTSPLASDEDSLTFHRLLDNTGDNKTNISVTFNPVLAFNSPTKTFLKFGCSCLSPNSKTLIVETPRGRSSLAHYLVIFTLASQVPSFLFSTTSATFLRSIASLPPLLSPYYLAFPMFTNRLPFTNRNQSRLVLVLYFAAFLKYRIKSRLLCHR